MSDFLQRLNPEQKRAALHRDGPLLILAGAGSGKTRVLVSRVGQLVRESSEPPGLCVLTFTNKAARELKQRVTQELGGPCPSLWAGTFHSFGLQLLRKNTQKLDLHRRFSVADTSDCQTIIKDLLVNITNTGKNSFQVDKLLYIINSLRSEPHKTLVEEEDYLAIAKMLLPRYEEKKKVLGVVDFEDLLLKPLELFERSPETLHKVRGLFKYVMVDEFQDTNELQMKLLRVLVEGHNNLAVVGDDDQSIYGWRGAKVKNILDFPKMFPHCEVIQLERNYRSSEKILDLANTVIKENKDRHGKVLKSEVQNQQSRKPEVFVFEDDEEEVQQVARQIEEFKKEGYAFSDMAVLYRSNGQGGFLETELRQSQVPYKISGGTAFFDRREVKDVMAYMQCLVWPKEHDLRRILNVPQRGVGDESIRRLDKAALHRNQDFVQCLKQYHSVDLPEQGRKGIELFFQQMAELNKALLDPEVHELDRELRHFFIKIGFQDYLRKFCKNDEALVKRWAGVEIFARVFANFMRRKDNPKKGLREFIDMMNLRDHEEDEAKDEVQLMTMHAAKGLEFPVVFIIGVEEDIIPHRQLGSDLSEERRLFYVGVTRAKERLVMSYTRSRKRYGKMQEVAPSRFLHHLPKDLYDLYPSGYRPVAEGAKDELLAQLQARLSAQAEKQRLE